MKRGSEFRAAAAATVPTQSLFKVCLIGSLSLALAMGVGRFAFTPMLPLMTRDGLLPGNQGAWLAASNYVGYLVGAMCVGWSRASSTQQMKASWIGIVLATACMGIGHTFEFWLSWRFAAGVLSASAMIATSAWILPTFATARRPALAGFVYAGVGVGIAVVGTFCLVMARLGATAQLTWYGLSALGIAIAGGLTLLIGSAKSEVSLQPRLSTNQRNSNTGLIILCYGIGGFGYILPATFLPAMARTLVDDPSKFGVAWPIFGIAAACSTLLVSYGFRQVNRLKLWSTANVLMATGAILPTLWPTMVAVGIAALLVGGTFLIVTMAGLQEARARAPESPTLLLSYMTTAFAIGQILGPVLTSLLGYLPMRSALSSSLQISALALVFAAFLLWCLARAAK